MIASSCKKYGLIELAQDIIHNQDHYIYSIEQYNTYPAQKVEEPAKISLQGSSDYDAL